MKCIRFSSSGQRHESEKIFGIQIAGAWPDELAKVAEIVDTFLDVDFIDINCGCPLDLMCNHGAGCKLELEKR